MEPFKNLLSPAVVQAMATVLAQHAGAPASRVFAHQALPGLEALELKARAQHLADALAQALPTDTARRRALLLALLHPVDGDEASDTLDSDAQGLRGWAVWPLTLVAVQQDVGGLEASLDLLHAMTQRASAEFAIRTLLLRDQAAVLAVLQRWVHDPSAAVRRLVSEGTRPRLPWGEQLRALREDPHPMLPLLQALRDDPSESVRRSVANHLNDIGKDHPDLLAELAQQWLVGAPESRVRLLRHACRSLIKHGHPQALQAFGLGAPALELASLKVLTPRVVLGQALRFRLELRSQSTLDQTLELDYVLHLRKAHGGTAPKVCKFKRCVLPAGQTLVLERQHPLRAVTVRRYYAGQQGLSLRINGVDMGQVHFALVLPVSQA